MQATRRARLQAVIQEELSVVVPRELKDPRIPSVTFTQVEVSPDAGMATVYVTLLGGVRGALEPSQEGEDGQEGGSGSNDIDLEAAEEAYNFKMKECLAGLTSASGFLRRHLARVLSIRQIPNLTFKADKGLENATRVYELLKEIGKPGSEN